MKAGVKLSFSFFMVICTIFAIVQCQSQDFLLESPRITNWGGWGVMERCPTSTYVYGMRLKVHPSAGVLVDDSALNGIELFCISPHARKNATQLKAFSTITSKVGHLGAWGNILECQDPFFVVGFQLRSEPNQYLADDTAGDNLRLFCSNGETLEGYGLDQFGYWTDERRCPRGTQICALQTQVEGPVADNTALNNVNTICCPLP